MLLNLSNHPSTHWPENQTKAAEKMFGSVNDLNFPHIDPTLSSADLDMLVEEYVSKVRNADPLAVHLMGELTFCYRLTRQLTSIGYRVVASTTQREVSADGNGNKVSIFRFVQFRDY